MVAFIILFNRYIQSNLKFYVFDVFDKYERIYMVTVLGIK